MDRDLQDRPVSDAEFEAELAASARLVARLRAADPDLPPRRSLAPEVLAAAASRRRRKPIPLFRFAAAAAILLACAYALRPASQGPVAPGPVASSDPSRAALDWLVRTQKADGSWDPAAQGGDGGHAVGVTGLALLALVEGREDAPARRAAAWLAGRQGADGRLGRASPTGMYDHAIATTALLREYGRTRDSQLRPAVSRAVAFLLAARTATGAWGYLGRADEAPNAAATAWPMLAFREAAALGWPEATRLLADGARYYGERITSEGRIGYDAAATPTLDAAGALCLLSHPEAGVRAKGVRVLESALLASGPGVGADPYRLFFLAEAARAAGGGAVWAPALEAARNALAALQVREGREVGSIPAETMAQGAAGGSVCSTALAALGLRWTAGS